MLQKQRVAADLDELVLRLRSRICEQRIWSQCDHGLPDDESDDCKDDEEQADYGPLGFPIQAYGARHIYLGGTISIPLPSGFLLNKREIAAWPRGAGSGRTHL